MNKKKRHIQTKILQIHTCRIQMHGKKVVPAVQTFHRKEK
jgi:hypothetical protein